MKNTWSRHVHLSQEHVQKYKHSLLVISKKKKIYNNNNNNKKQNVKSNSTAQVWSYIDHVFIQSPAAETPQL